MTSLITKIPRKSLNRLIPLTRTSTSRVLLLSQNMCTSTKPSETQTQKLERIADELLSLTNIERYDYDILWRHKMGLHQLGPAVSGPPAEDNKKAAEEEKKSVFDVKLEKFDTSARLKIIKEVRGFTDLGLKDAKDLVDKAPIVVKKGLTKEEADSIAEKLKAVGATVVLE